MATLYDRVAGRGFAGGTVAGKTGAGALESQGAAQHPRHGAAVKFEAPQTLPQFEPDPPTPVAVLILDGMWGIPGSADLDPAPRNHSAPAPPWTGDDTGGPDRADLRADADALHGIDYGAPARRREQYEANDPTADRWSNLNTGESLLTPVPDQVRGQGGRDIDQGYARANGYGFDAGHRDRTTLGETIPMAYLDPAERAWIVATAHGTFYPTDEVQGPDRPGNFINAPGVAATPPTAYTPPPDPAVSATPPVGAPPSVGWW